MRARTITAALTTALLTAVLAAPAAAAGSHSVPPAAPSPTDGANSPAAPDPHPRRGGIGPDGEPVGGTQLLGRGEVLPAGTKRSALPADITAQAWMVTDLDTGRVVAARDPHGRYQPASIQKVLTTVALLPVLPGPRTVTVSRRSADTEGSHAGLVAGGRYTVDQLFRGLLLVSGNDCAEALAAAAGGRAKTVALMNRTARALGAYDTYVQTPSGLDGWQQLTSAYDMTLFLRAALAQPRFAAYDRVAKSTLPFHDVVGKVTLYNQNQEFLTTVKGALVAKTGYTDAAQHTFVGAIERGGHRYGVVLLRAQRWPVDQWVQAKRLVSWARSLPATARVGTLATPARAEGDARARATTAAPGATAAAAPTGGSSVPLWAQAAIAAVLLAGVLGLAQRMARRH
ncbi:D-alanyl-D-alanine carboxypeptidase (penicillin-binding protein 5/6) [Jatrophihabitans endophyticus]|uniref:D-alanyl-D-alanine carboxypeptidase (Penicillin-binding protein 5/6) n=1 Tax=Jatrophihabitans endophyticus TaxID=1206085 RepID=A0A1M5GBZ0_9ACTN|nr:serine hydrolase [Jatrophihabitans endophyticus]SHG01001.1 D-alanyl-D-alanine carboxypeptidase (penicillin-binding protein 5/6) [Jatrophihabitans endophyticus]